MSQRSNALVWNHMPIVRILLPFIAGIILQWYVQFSCSLIIIVLCCFIMAISTFNFLPLGSRYKLQPLQGALFNLIMISFGLLLTWQKDVRHQINWYGKHYQDSGCMIVRIEEPLIEKANSFKADASVEAVIKADSPIACNGKLLLYLSKETATSSLRYGDRILIKKDLQPIKNSGNPGAFNYQRYAAFQQIVHNVYLKEKDWIPLPRSSVNLLRQFIFSSREKVLSVLEKNIKGKDELSIAEALLIGYTNDLDKDLVQAYSNTGVVHIIAISGMHLGLIYLLLMWIFAHLPFIKRSKILQLVLILSCLWLFALITGGSASVLRSAVMFSFIKFGQTFFKRSSIFNSLAASAFVVLCYDPFYLWNVGFQLSYLAVIGIVFFQRPIYDLIYIKNKWLDKVWGMAAVTMAAQLLTFPICVYYFHQFPILFLITNLIAVPLSTIILYAAIFLLAFSWVPLIGTYTGLVVQGLVWLMNKVIMQTNRLPFAVWDNLPASILSTVLLYISVIALCAWLINRYKPAFKMALTAVLLFAMLQTYARWHTRQQKKLIVYNVPRQQAIDIIDGNNYQFIGDSVLLENGLLQNFHLKPARIKLQLYQRVDLLPALFKQDGFLLLGNKKILLIDRPLLFETTTQKMPLDIIILSKNPKIKIAQLATVFDCKQYVLDASNSLYRVEKWKKECDELKLSYYAVADKGAFIHDIDK